jgi:hypothetical protein
LAKGGHGSKFLFHSYRNIGDLNMYDVDHHLQVTLTSSARWFNDNDNDAVISPDYQFVAAVKAQEP